MSASLALFVLSVSAFAQDKSSTAGTAGVVGGDGVYRAPLSTTAYRGTTALTVRLAGPLKWHHCASDGDGDCLNDFYEDELAALVSPLMFFDADEECASGTWEFHAYHQVRPRTDRTGPVSAWQDDGQTKSVVITYFFNYPLDCGHGFEGDHMGDSEHVVLTLEGEDLRSWRLVDMAYYHHGTSERRDGQWLRDRAAALGTTFPVVLVEDDKHGSWWGADVNSDHCAGSEDNYAFGSVDCLDQTLAQDFAAGRAFLLDTSRNVGEPPDVDGDGVVESCVRFNTDGYPTGGALVRDPNGAVYTELDLGLGLGSVREYWWNAPAGQERFCGWTCTNSSRDAHGDCPAARFTIASGADTFENCATGLSEKVDTTSFDTSGIDWCAVPADPPAPADDALIALVRKVQASLAARIMEQTSIRFTTPASDGSTSIHERYPDLLAPDDSDSSDQAGEGKDTDSGAVFAYVQRSSKDRRTFALQADLPDGTLAWETACDAESCTGTIHFADDTAHYRWDCTRTAKGTLECVER
mgnify:FL=1